MYFLKEFGTLWHREASQSASTDARAQQLEQLRRENERLRQELEDRAKQIADQAREIDALTRKLALGQQNSTATSKPEDHVGYPE